MKLDLDNRTVLVTGSTSGIGKATAAAYLAEGARVILHGLTEAEVEATRAELGGGAAIETVVADVSTADGVASLLGAIEAFGPLDILVNNVGIFNVKPFGEISDAEWQEVLDVNLLSAVRLSRSILPAMLARGRGAIVNIASEAGVKPLPQMVHYSTSKSALIGLTRGMAETTKGTEVRVNSVLPGPTWTAGVERYFVGLAAADGRPMDAIIADYFRREEPTSLIQRFVRPEEVAQLVVFISAHAAMNGGAYRVEGGIIRSVL